MEPAPNYDSLMDELDHFDTTNLQPFDDIIDEYMFPIKQFADMISKIDEKYERYTQLLSCCDSAREDITHYMEFNRMNASERAKLMNKLIDVLKVRRMVKTHLTCIQTIRDGWFVEQGINMYQRAVKVMSTITKLDEQSYRDRTSVIRDTFGGADNGTTT